MHFDNIRDVSVRTLLICIRFDIVGRRKGGWCQRKISNSGRKSACEREYL